MRNARDIARNIVGSGLAEIESALISYGEAEYQRGTKEALEHVHIMCDEFLATQGRKGLLDVVFNAFKGKSGEGR